MQALAFYIDAPLQSWGASSKYQYRETNNFPTKSAIIGILAAALGIDKHSTDEAEKIVPLADLKFTAVKIPKAQASTLLTDFHTIGGGYDKASSQREKMSIPRKASGAPFGTVITRRTYLTDASFVAILEGNEATIESLKNALLNPVWGIWFGRKTCLPATPLTPTTGKDTQQAFDTLLDQLPDLNAAPLDSFERLEEINSDEETQGDYYQSDQPIAFGQHFGPVPAAYRARGIRHHRPE